MMTNSYIGNGDQPGAEQSSEKTLMSDTPIPGTPSGAQAVPEITITKEVAEALGFGNVEELQSKVQQHMAANRSAEGLEALSKDLTEATAALTTAINTFREEKVKIAQDEAFEELSKERIVDTFKALPEDDPKRAEIAKALLANHGANDVALVLEGTELTKSLLRPISKNNPDFDRHHEFRKAWDYTFMLTALMKGITQGANDAETRIDRDTLMQSVKKLEDSGVYGIDVVKAHIEKAMAAATSGYGADWVPSILSGDMVNDIWLNLQVAGLFRRYQMPSPTFTLPIRTSRSRAYLMDEITSDTNRASGDPFFTNQIIPTNMGTGSVQFIARKLAAVIFMNDEIEQDSIIGMLEMLREEILYAHADSIEDATINGVRGTQLSDVQGKLDNCSSNGANRRWSDAGAGIRDARAAWTGLRHSINLSGVTLIDGAVVTAWKDEGLDFYRNGRKEMGKYGAVTTDDLVWIISPEQHIELLKLTQVVTMEKIGNRATILSGQIGELDGVPLVISPRVPADLNNKGVFTNGEAVTVGAGNGWLTGVTTGTQTNKTVAILVNRRGYAFGDRQYIRAESERQPLAGQRYVMATWRGDFRKLFSTGEYLANAIYDLAK